MRNRQKTIASLKRLAERPGTPAEGDTARRLLAEMVGNAPQSKPFVLSDWPRGTEVYYNYWSYGNAHGVIVGKDPKIIEGQVWLRIKFDHYKQVRRVPITSRKGCHLSRTPLPKDEVDFMWRIWSDD